MKIFEGGNWARKEIVVDENTTFRGGNFSQEYPPRNPFVVDPSVTEIRFEVNPKTGTGCNLVNCILPPEAVLVGSHNTGTANPADLIEKTVEFIVDDGSILSEDLEK